MIKQFLWAACAVLALSGSAIAAECAGEIKKVDAAMTSASLHPSQANTVKTIRDMANRLNQAGREQDCLQAIGHAKTLLANLGSPVK